MPPKKFIENQNNETNRYSHIILNKLCNAIETILESGFHAICNKYNITDYDSANIVQYLYEDTRCRHHFGKETLCLYRKNNFVLAPALDPELRMVKLNTSDCPDYNLLVALIFSRYEPDLVTFPFDSNRFIAPETIEYAKKINERFPLVNKDKTSVPEKSVFHLQLRDTQAEKILSSGRNNPDLLEYLPKTCLKAAFESSRTFGLFSAYFDEEFYHYAADFYEKYIFGRERPLYAILGVTRVLEDVEISQRTQPLYQDIKRFLNHDFATIHDDENKIPINFQNYLTARIDIKLMSTTSDFKIFSVSDNKATVWKPSWFQNDGIGYQIQSYIGKLEFIAKSTVNGQIQLYLRGLDIRSSKDRSKRIPYWIDYTKFTVNGETIFDKITPAWHDKFYNYEMDTKAGEEVKIEVEWLPHRSDT